MCLRLTAYLIIPVYTLLFVRDTDWMRENLSVIGSWPGRQSAFFGLGVVVGLYFHQVLGRLARLLPGKGERRLLHLALWLLLAAVSTPYLPERVPFQAFLHVAFAFSASLILLFCLFQLVWKLPSLGDRERLWKMMEPYRRGLLAISGVSGILFAEAGIISTALEVFYLISTAVFVQRLYERITAAGL